MRQDIPLSADHQALSRLTTISGNLTLKEVPTDLISGKYAG
jgi:hypothetical protein